MLGHSQIGRFAIGQIANPSTVPLASTWLYGWSEPVRFKVVPKRRVALIASGPFAPVLNPDNQIINNNEARWHQGWSEPVRLNLKHPLKTAHQKAWFGPDRYLPKPDVSIVIAATETNADDAEIDVYIYDETPPPYQRFASVNVSIYEIVDGSALSSITETED